MKVHLNTNATYIFRHPYLNKCLPVFLPVFLSACPSVCLLVCLCLSVCLLLWEFHTRPQCHQVSRFPVPVPGLRKVTDDMKTHKNPALRGSSVVKATDIKPAAKTTPKFGAAVAAYSTFLYISTRTQIVAKATTSSILYCYTKKHTKKCK